MSKETGDVEDQIGYEEQEWIAQTLRDRMERAMEELSKEGKDYAICYSQIKALRFIMTHTLMNNLHVDADEAAVLLGFTEM